MTFATRTKPVSVRFSKAADQIYLPSITAVAESCMGGPTDPSAVPEGH